MRTPVKHPKIALVYDRVNTRYGGAEHVLESLHYLFPEAPLFTSVYDRENTPWASTIRVIPSFLQQFPFAQKLHRQYVAFMPLAFETLCLDDYDLVISITSAEAKGILTKPDQLHLCYLLTPTRYLWSHQAEYRQSWPAEQLKQQVFRYLRWWDKAAALRPDVYIPISKLVQRRCELFYQRTTDAVLYPPVELPPRPDQPCPLPQLLSDQGTIASTYYLTVARLVGYKKIDLIIDACGQLKRQLVIVGDGPDFFPLQHYATQQYPQAKIIFIRSVQSSELEAYYKNCRAFLAPGEEDFGIAALEAHAYGKPAILFTSSGAAEMSPDKQTSIHLQTQSAEALKQAIETLEQQKWSAAQIRDQVAQFGTEAFQRQFYDRVMMHWQQFLDSQ